MHVTRRVLGFPRAVFDFTLCHPAHSSCRFHTCSRSVYSITHTQRLDQKERRRHVPHVHPPRRSLPPTRLRLRVRDTARPSDSLVGGYTHARELDRRLEVPRPERDGPPRYRALVQRRRKHALVSVCMGDAHGAAVWAHRD